MKNYVVLYNPLANNGRAEQSARKLEAVLTDGEVRFVDIAALGSFYDFFVSCDDDCIVILTGGDGTLHHFVNDTRGLKIKQKIYYYGAGSGNDFLNDLGKERGAEPFDIGEYIKDLPVVRVNGKDIIFINNVGFGLDGYVCETGNRERKDKKKPINYTSIALRGLLREFSPRRATVTVDGVTKKYERVWLAPTTNGRYFGGGMKIAPDQDRLASDGKMTFIVVHDLSRARIIPIFPEIFKGTHVRHTKYIEVVKCDEVTVRFDASCAMQIDGESISDVIEYTAYSRNAVKKRKA
ncbi:MAG: diacylglycerol kinase family protein [Clostridia bacterium]|nr:diacylglycerol kinase family protein [Clostridia bacterium]MBQ3227543.1 diacylglycerol kinase family protein [Clostridia bacterium]MBR4063253.1 diacylglycerol kinase family protein [Clostridia bacterium]